MLKDYLELTKPRVTALVTLTAWIGFCLGEDGSVNVVKLLGLLLGTVLVAGGSSALNQYIERDSDAKMKRTQMRPLPQGRLQPPKALLFGLILSLGGIGTLLWSVNFLTSVLAFLALLIYLFFYIPLKPSTPLCTAVGALSGAIPPVMGWTACRNALNPEAWILFTLLYLWQFPHFLSLAKIFREDYAQAGFRMLPVIDLGGGVTARTIVLYTLALVLVSLFPFVKGISGVYYFFAALTLGLIFLGLGFRCVFSLSTGSKGHRCYKRFFLASIIYLPALLILLVMDQL